MLTTSSWKKEPAIHQTHVEARKVPEEARRCFAGIPQGPRSAIILLSNLNLHPEGRERRPGSDELGDLLYLLTAMLFRGHIRLC